MEYDGGLNDLIMQITEIEKNELHSDTTPSSKRRKFIEEKIEKYMENINNKNIKK
tara:strand:+ start:214 stop:378 length:165 start_codon:yes stop_codon:yes gene_type:complete